MRKVAVNGIAAWCFLCLVAFAHTEQAQAANVQVVGLFPGSAILLIDGQRRFLKSGHEAGAVKLISANSQQAIVLVNGERKTLTLTRERSNGFSEAPDKPVVQLVRSNDGHYWTMGKINGRSIRMMLDTGASDISLSEADAERLGIAYRHGRRAIYHTANGKVQGFQIMLASVTIRGITLRNVQASVVPSDHPVLLGMSFLREVNMREEGNILHLVPRY